MPSLPDNDQSCNSHLAALTALNIITQVLDEAQDIANAAKYSGRSWRHIWDQKKANGECYKNAKILRAVDLEAECEVEDYEINQSNMTKNYSESGLIGQGDENIQMRSTDFRSPSMVINCLFDMSEIEEITSYEYAEDNLENMDSRDFLNSTVTQIVESYVNLALNTVSGDGLVPANEIPESIQESNRSSYSLLGDDIGDITENVMFYVDRDEEDEVLKDTPIAPTKKGSKEDLEEIRNKDIHLYENTFSTLNRDYDKCSEQEDYLEDQKSMTMQEVELPSNIIENIDVYAEPVQSLIKVEEPVVPAIVVGTHKHGLIKRCRLQGTRFMNRLRSWWWKQRLIGKRKESRSSLMPGGMCPLSPNARSRAASLLDNRKLRSPSPLRTIAWNFNTLNEALINSYSTKEFENLE